MGGVASGYATLGHRFHHPDAITIGGANDYVEKLRACHVLVDHAEREAGDALHEAGEGRLRVGATGEGGGIVLVTHDLGVVAETCDTVSVMYCGQIVESADVDTLFNHPAHPYTKGLMDSIPSFDSTSGHKKERLQTIEGMVPSLFDLPSGCNFQDRCSKVTDECRGPKGDPTLNPSKGEGHLVACFNPLN